MLEDICCPFSSWAWTDDRRPEFQRMIDAATTKPPAFDVVVVHSFSRFFRDQFHLDRTNGFIPGTEANGRRSWSMSPPSNWPRNRLLLALPSRDLKQLSTDLEHIRCQ